MLSESTDGEHIHDVTNVTATAAMGALSVKPSPALPSKSATRPCVYKRCEWAALNLTHTQLLSLARAVTQRPCGVGG